MSVPEPRVTVDLWEDSGGRCYDVRPRPGERLVTEGRSVDVTAEEQEGLEISADTGGKRCP